MTARLRPASFVCLLWLSLCLSACRSPPQLRNQYSLLQLSEVQQLASGLKLRMRLSNFGEKEMEIRGLEFTLTVAGQPGIRQQRSFPEETLLPGFGTEPLEFEVPGGRLPTDTADTESLHYTLAGKVFRGSFGGGIEFRHEGRLSPVPGIPGAWR